MWSLQVPLLVMSWCSRAAAMEPVALWFGVNTNTTPRNVEAGVVEVVAAIDVVDVVAVAAVAVVVVVVEVVEAVPPVAPRSGEGDLRTRPCCSCCSACCPPAGKRGTCVHPASARTCAARNISLLIAHTPCQRQHLVSPCARASRATRKEWRRGETRLTKCAKRVTHNLCGLQF